MFMLNKKCDQCRFRFWAKRLDRCVPIYGVTASGVAGCCCQGVKLEFMAFEAL
ncbi:hypothetical protein DSUL_260003 [Desulfovibrionales bacterium]